MPGDRTFTCQSSISFTKRFKKFWQLSTAYWLIIEQIMVVGQDLWGVWGCFQSCRRRSMGADIRPWTRLHGNHSTSKYDELVFLSLFHAFSLSSDQLEWAIKSPPHKEQPKKTRCLASTGLLLGSNAGLVLHWAIRLGEPETWHRNLEYTESEPEERRQKKPGCSCSAKQKLGWCSIRLCFLDVFHTKKIRRQVCLKPNL